MKKKKRVIWVSFNKKSNDWWWVYTRKHKELNKDYEMVKFVEVKDA